MLHKNMKITNLLTYFSLQLRNASGEVLIQHVLFLSLPAMVRPAPALSPGLQEGV